MRRLQPVFDIARYGAIEAIRVGKFNFALNTRVHAFRIGNTMIDTGCPSAANSVDQYIQARAGVLKQALASHFHEGESMLFVVLASLPCSYDQPQIFACAYRILLDGSQTTAETACCCSSVVSRSWLPQEAYLELRVSAQRCACARIKNRV